MTVLIFIILLFILFYISIIVTAYKEFNEKNIKVPFDLKAQLFLLLIPAFVSYIHIKAFIKLYKDDRKKANQFLKYGTFELVVGVTIFIEYLVHSYVLESVYEITPSKKEVRVKTQSKKLKRELINLSALRTIFRNPVPYQKTLSYI